MQADKTQAARFMDAAQMADLLEVFKGWDNTGNLDYVSCWYKKAADMMKGTETRAALVSTNNVTQGGTPSRRCGSRFSPRVS